MADVKRVLDLLDKKTLLQISQVFGFKDSVALNKADIIKRLARERSLSLNEVLANIRTSALKSLCRDLGARVSPSNRQSLIKRTLVQAELMEKR